LPEPYNEIRALKLNYGRRLDDIEARRDLSPRRQEELAGGLWFETNRRLDELRKQLPRKQRCTAITRSGTRCSKWAMPDYIALLTVMAFLNGWRSMIASGLGMESAPDDKVTVMSMRAAANQFGYLLGAALGGLALAASGFGLMGMTFSSLFALGARVHRAPRMTSGPRAAAQPA
jgi:hypothetical protein